MEILWTKQAEDSFNKTIDYLLEKWTLKEANNFIDIVDHTIFQISNNPELFKISIFDVESREAVITNQTSLFYRIVNAQTIEIEYFWNNYRNPNHLEKSVKDS
ncbi:type II toxin-antitoxin system RelE/ParE family toxin [Lacinutrix sp.]|uniref:type II toxin-antitoxin system RelE/ParE family toxin n=1 Tax=Lacinutrix sp. TaxID=1937692 RepID=UPI0025C47193|nr:type II toxin-antitoxin system RelE/ParE family toxin [Lacinutrix sp.]